MDNKTELNGFRDGARVTIHYNKGKQTAKGWIRGIWYLSFEDELPIYIVSDEGYSLWADSHGHILDSDNKVRATISPEI